MRSWRAAGSGLAMGGVYCFRREARCREVGPYV